MSLYPPLKHPLHSSMSLSGHEIGTLDDLVTKVWAESRDELWRVTKLSIASPDYFHLAFDTPGNLYRLGEIGFSYLIYRLNPDLMPLAMKLFRQRNILRLQELLDGLTPGKTHDHIITTSIDGELLGILSNYYLLRNLDVVNAIKKHGLSERVAYWRWTPLRCKVYLKAKTIHERFRFGMTITNGETGHTAMSFSSAVWAYSELHAGGEVRFDWETPIRERGYARHTSARRLIRQLDRFDILMRDNAVSLAFESLDEVNATVAGIGIERVFVESKARQSVKDKFEALLTDALRISSGGTCLDVVESILVIADTINTKSAADFGEELIAEVLNGVRAVKGIDPTIRF